MVTFDESLGRFTEALLRHFDVKALEAGWVVRDAAGYLSFVGSNPIDEVIAQQAAKSAFEMARPYTRADWAVIGSDFPGIESILSRANPYKQTVATSAATLTLKVVDQRIVGADWLSMPAPSAGGAPRYVFASIKGGVGRTTSLAVAARDLAQFGQKVLVIDLDLEAPGIGSMLLTEAQLPKYGMLDACVESVLADLGREFLLDMAAPSDFGGGKGLIDVVPAVGQSAANCPENMLAKLARAYIESSIETDGKTQSFAQRTRWLVDKLCELKRYDAVLIDARPGLNESTGPALLSLGAKVLLFGEDTPQTFSGYRFLLSHLARFPRSEDDDWLERLRMVHAKAPAQSERQQMFRDRAYEIFREFLYQEAPLDTDVSLPEFTLDDAEGPHYAIPVLRDSHYFDFDPLSDPSVLNSTLYEGTYGALLRSLNPVRASEEDPQ